MQNDEEFQEQLEKIFLESAYLNSEEFNETVKNETERFTKLAEETGIRK